MIWQPASDSPPKDKQILGCTLLGSISLYDWSNAKKRWVANDEEVWGNTIPFAFWVLVPDYPPEVIKAIDEENGE